MRGMSAYEDLFRGKKVTLMGLGLLGRGVGDAEFLAQCGAHVVVTDIKTEHELEDSIKRLSMYDMTFHLGGHRMEDFTSADIVIKGAGVPLRSHYIDAAKAAGVPVFMSTALFSQLAMEQGVRIIGVTGTRGKSTTSYLINRSLAHAGEATHYGGNVRGVSTLAMLAKIKRGDFAVLELDSWQLQGFGELHISPQIAVFTNLMPDHLNYYPDMAIYFADKANIFRYQKEGDFLFVGPSVEEQVRQANPPVEPIVPPLPPKEWKIQIRGQHNLENVALSSAALRAAGLSEDEIRTGVETFTGIEGRLQFLREIRSVSIYNDNNATTPEATIAALQALESPITLIIGGSDKGLSLEELVLQIKRSSARVIVLRHSAYSGSERLTKEFAKVHINFDEARDLSSALQAALHSTQHGSILFSPAFASFGMFKNEYDRNDQFVKLVRGL